MKTLIFLNTKGCTINSKIENKDFKICKNIIEYIQKNWYNIFINIHIIKDINF